MAKKIKKLKAMIVFGYYCNNDEGESIGSLREIAVSCPFVESVVVVSQGWCMACCFCGTRLAAVDYTVVVVVAVDVQGSDIAAAAVAEKKRQNVFAETSSPVPYNPDLHMQLSVAYTAFD